MMPRGATQRAADAQRKAEATATSKNGTINAYHFR